MVEETKEAVKDEKEETTPQDTTPEVIKRAESAYGKLKSEIDRQEKLLKEMRELEARRLMGGGSEGGTTVDKSNKETPQEYADRVLRGEA